MRAAACILFVLSFAVPVNAQTPPPRPQRPTFDCAKASGEVEQMICKDPALIALDRQLADVYARALKRLPVKIAAEQRNMQRGWINERNGCADRDAPRACIEVTYQMRIVELQIKSGQLKVPKPVGYLCTGGEDQPLTVTFYSETQPQSAVIMYGNNQVIAFWARAENGARYTTRDVDFLERDGEATLIWSGARMTCKPAEPKPQKATQSARGATKAEDSGGGMRHGKGSDTNHSDRHDVDVEARRSGKQRQIADIRR